MGNSEWSSRGIVPQGDDGAEIMPPQGMGPVSPAGFHKASQCFKEMALALEADDRDMAQKVLKTYLDSYNEKVDPFGYLTMAGINSLAWILRKMAGDPHPYGQPTGVLSGTIIAESRETSELVKSWIHEFAIDVVLDAANWQWKDFHRKMEEFVDNTSVESLAILYACLIDLFIGVDGIELAEWR